MPPVVLTDESTGHPNALAQLGPVLAVVAGILGGSAANIASYFATLEKRSGQQQAGSRRCLVDLGVVVISVVSGLTGTVAFASGGPVAVLNAITVATTLLVNMVMQIVLGISYYNKDMRIGTFIFLVAVYQLAHLGPSPRGDIDIVATLSKPLAVGWIVSIFAMMACSGVAVYATLSMGPENIVKIFVWSLLLSTLGVLTNNGASLFGMLKGVYLGAAFIIYGLVSVVVIFLSAKGPALCEAAVFVPMNLCLVMVLNMVTGFLVWEDGERLNDKNPYIATFLICLFSVYITSTNLDIVVSGRVGFGTAKHKLERSAFGRSVVDLLASWQVLKMAPGDEAATAAASKAFRGMLGLGISRGILSEAALGDLAGGLLGEASGFEASAVVVHWLEQTPYLKNCCVQDVDLSMSLRSTLSPAELAKLEVMSATQIEIEMAHDPNAPSRRLSLPLSFLAT